MRIAIITASYPRFLETLYRESPSLASRSYADQLTARNESLFAFADFYSRGFQAHGHEAAEFHVNDPWLQHAWAREHGMDAGSPPPPWRFAGTQSWRGQLVAKTKTVLRPVVRSFLPPPMPGWQTAILRAQIEDFKPDVIYNQEPSTVQGSFLRRVGKPGRRIIGQIASARPRWENFRDYDLVVSSLPNFVAWFRGRGIPSAYNRLAFEPSVVEKIGGRERDIPLSFVGSVAPVHVRRLKLLEYVAQRLPLKIWGWGIERLPASSPLHGCYQGQAFGRDMLDILGRSQITLNNHEAVSGNYANTLRLYEASGMGAMQIVDHKSDLHEIFVLDEEVVAYEAPADCVKKLEVLMASNQPREKIASAGQRRTLETHNYYQRTGQLLEIFRAVIAGEAGRFI